MSAPVYLMVIRWDDDETMSIHHSHDGAVMAAVGAYRTAYGADELWPTKEPDDAAGWLEWLDTDSGLDWSIDEFDIQP